VVHLVRGEVQDLADVVGQAGGLERVEDALGGERRLGGGLENHRVAGEEGGNEGVDLDKVWRKWRGVKGQRGVRGRVAERGRLTRELE